MANNSMDKIKEFFGFGEVASYQDGYQEDGFREERGYPRYGDVREDPRDRRRDERPAPRGASYSSYDDAAPRPRPSYGASAGAGSDSYGGRHSERPVQPAEPVYTALTLGNYTQAGDLATELKSGGIVAFSLSGMEKAEARRVLDFAAGLARGLDANLKKLSGLRNFVLIPAGISLDQDQLDALARDL